MVTLAVCGCSPAAVPAGAPVNATPANAEPAAQAGPPMGNPNAAEVAAGRAATGPAEPKCTALDCRLFDSAGAAFSFVLESKPLVLAMGEAHALKGTEHVESSTARFTNQLLPLVAATASDIIIELMEPDRRCLKTTERVRKEQQQVTQSQATTNQNEFVTLGTRAKALGITPHILYPTCAQYDHIVTAGDDSIFVMLETIASLTEQKARALLERNHEAGVERTVLLYGGAVHNDLAPRPGRESWSYGPGLNEVTGGRYVEVDLIVREFIKDTEVWQSQAWYPHFDKTSYQQQAVLFQPSPRSFVLIFPTSS